MSTAPARAPRPDAPPAADPDPAGPEGRAGRMPARDAPPETDARAEERMRPDGGRAEMEDTPADGGRAEVLSPGLLAGPYRTPTIGILLLVSLLAGEAMAVGAAMPVAARDLHGIALYAWGFSAVSIAGLVANVVAGGWADARGPGGPLVIGLGVFVTGLLVAGTAPAMGWFVAGRAVQGFGTGLAVVPLYVVVARVYREESRPKVFAAMSAAWVLPALAGPVAGGFVAVQVGWRWVFLGLVPLVVPAALMLAPVARQGEPAWPGAETVSRGPAREEVPWDGTRRADAPGGHASRGHAADGHAPGGQAARVVPARTAAVAACALAAGSAVVLWAVDHRSPVGVAGLAALAYGLRVLLPRGTLRLRHGLPAGIAVRGLLMGAMTGTEAFIPLALITRHGFSPTAAGIVLTGGALGWCGGSWWQGRSPAASRVRFAVAGAALLAVGIGAVELSLYASGWPALPAWAVAGLGMGMAFPAISVQVLNMSGERDQGANSSALQISDTLGSSFGVGVAGALVNLVGLGAGAACTLLIAVVAAVAAHRVEDSRA